MVGALGYQGNGWAMGTGHANLYYPEGNWVSLDNAHRSILWMCDKSRSYWVGEVQKGSDQIPDQDTKGNPNQGSSQPKDWCELSLYMGDNTVHYCPNKFQLDNHSDTSKG